MKTKIMLTSAAALLVSVAGANAGEIRPFAGLTMGIQHVVYTDSMQDRESGAGAIDLPNNFFVFGAEGGVRFGNYNAIYNGGLTVSATKTTYSDVEDKYSDVRVASTDMFNISATYDNYFRISGDKTSRIDLVLGTGLGAMATHINYVEWTNIKDTTKWSFAPEFKVGMDFELTHNVTLSANARMFIPTRAHYTMDTAYIFGGAVKYMF